MPPPPLQLLNPNERNENINNSLSLKVFPNPSTGQVNFEFYIDKKSNVTISLFDIYGNELMLIVNKEFNQGTHKFNYYVGNLSSGIYICKIKANNKSMTSKIILSK